MTGGAQQQVGRGVGANGIVTGSGSGGGSGNGSGSYIAPHATPNPAWVAAALQANNSDHDDDYH